MHYHHKLVSKSTLLVYPCGNPYLFMLLVSTEMPYAAWSLLLTFAGFISMPNAVTDSFTPFDDIVSIIFCYYISLDLIQTEIGFTSLVFSTLHFPLCAALILVSAAMSRMTAFENNVSSAIRWYFSGGLGVSIFTLALIGFTHRGLDPKGTTRIERVCFAYQSNSLRSKPFYRLYNLVSVSL